MAAKQPKKPLISIIIATRNMAEELEECLLNIISLSFRDKEIIVVDGASRDNTRDVLQKHSHHLANWISEPDSGIYDALNKGITMAQGDFLYFLGADDRLLDNLNQVAPYLKDQNTIYYGDVILSRSQKLYDGFFTLYKLARTNICHQAIFYPKSVFRTYKFSLKYPIQADWELNMRLLGKSLYRSKYINVPISIFAEEGVSSTRDDHVFNEEYLQIIKKNFPLQIYIYRRILLNILFTVKLLIPHALLVRLNKLKLRL